MGIVADSIYKKKVVHRYDGEDYIKYFTSSDFDGLLSDPYSFMSGKNRLNGSFYSYPGWISDTLVIFCHGIGGGHLSYMREIEYLCRLGYRVFAYDNTGCCASGGSSIRGRTQALADLDAALNALKTGGIYGRYKKVFVIGHSLGGYAAGNIPNYHSGLSGVVVISGYVSLEQVLRSEFGGPRGLINRYMFGKTLGFEAKANPSYVFSSSLDAVNGAKTRFLIFHSEDDPVAVFSYHGGYLREHCVNSDARFVIYKDRKHNPNYLPDARMYMEEVFSGFAGAVAQKKIRTEEEKKAFFANVDWLRMTRQDDSFWTEVSSFLSSADV